MLNKNCTLKSRGKSGIYCIYSDVGGKCYFGSASNLRGRYSSHINELRRGIHKNGRLQNHYNKYGKESLIFEIVAYCPKEYLIKMEQWFIDHNNNDFNISKIAGNTLGVKCSDETKKKISKANTGRKLSLEHVEKSTRHFRGIKLSEEHRKKIGESFKRNPENTEKLRLRVRGENCPTGKLTEKQVILIKKSLSEGVKGRELAKIFNVDENSISNIKRGKTWKHVL